MLKFHTTSSFSLLEIVLVMMLMSVLAGLAIPQYTNVIERMESKNAENILRELYGAQQRYYTENRSYAVNLSDLDIDPPPNSRFETPVVCSPSDATDRCDSDDSLAEIERKQNSSKDPQYTLGIDQEMTVTCENPAPDNICSRLGF